MKDREKNKKIGRVKFYADENINLALVKALQHFQNVNIKTASGLGYSGRDDLFHFREAKRLGRFLLTSDRDFLNHSKFPFNQMHGVVILNSQKEAIDFGYFSLWLTEHIVPSRDYIEGTKIVVYRDQLDILSVDETGKVVKNRVPYSFLHLSEHGRPG